MLSLAASGAAAQSDTGAVGPLFTYRDAILAGGFVIAARLVHPLDEHYALRLQDSSTQANAKLQTLATFVRRTAFRASPERAERLFTVHYACLAARAG